MAGLIGYWDEVLHPLTYRLRNELCHRIYRAIIGFRVDL